LAPASFAMASKKTEEECSQELNKRMWLSVIENQNQLQTSHCVQNVKISSTPLRLPSTDHIDVDTGFMWKPVPYGTPGSLHKVQILENSTHSLFGA
jgi:hypothetical protein